MIALVCLMTAELDCSSRTQLTVIPNHFITKLITITTNIIHFSMCSAHKLNSSCVLMSRPIAQAVKNTVRATDYSLTIAFTKHVNQNSKDRLSFSVIIFVFNFKKSIIVSAICTRHLHYNQIASKKTLDIQFVTPKRATNACPCGRVG